MKREQKQAQVADIQERVAKMACMVLTDFRGVNVEDMTALRDEFRKVGVDYKVVKNRLLGLAVKDSEYAEALQPYLKEPTGAAWSYDDPSAPAKVAVAFAKKNPLFRIKCAVLDGQVLDENGVESLSKMPGKAELLSTLLATFMEPGTGFVRQLQAPAQNFVYLLDARRRQLEGE